MGTANHDELFAARASIFVIRTEAQAKERLGTQLPSLALQASTAAHYNV
jgi:hypothetical protein